jgi:hypothetical protein
MSDIFREVDEELRRDRFENLSKRFGPLFIAVALVAVVGTGGYVSWQNWQQSRAEAETAQLTEALRLATADNTEKPGTEKPGTEAAADALTAFAGEAGAGRGTLARLYAAGLRARNGDTSTAVATYDQIAGASDVEPVYRNLATVLSVLHQVETGNPGELQARLAPLAAEGSPWRHTARDLSALLAAKAGDRAKAHDLYSQLADDPTAPAGVRTRAADLSALYADPQ